jgi:WD40 repeat protein
MSEQPLLIQDADFGPPPTKSREAPWEKLYRFFFGDDVFISYSRADAIRYVPSLAARLAAKGHICFFDQLAADPSEELPERLKKKILRSTVFVLVGTKGAVASSFVRKEVGLFRRTRRPFIPVDVDGALIEQEGWREVVGVAKIREEGARVRDGDPSPEVINLIKDSFRYTRRSQWLRASLLAGVSVILITAAASLFLIRTAEAKIRAAETEAAAIKRQAEAEVAAANTKVGEAQARLESITAEAANARKQADKASAAAEAASAQRQAAEHAMRQAQELEHQAAERAADTSRREAGSRAALLSREPGRGFDALALAEEAAEQSVAHRGELSEQVWNGLTTSAAAVDYGLPLEGLESMGSISPVISPGGEKIVSAVYDVRSKSGKLVFWDSETGKIIKTSPEVNGLMYSLTFSRDGRRLAAVLNGADPFELIFWDVAGSRATRLKSTCAVPSHASYLTLGLALDSDGSHALILGRDLTVPYPVVTLCELDSGRGEVLTDSISVQNVAFTPEDEPAVYAYMGAHGTDAPPPALYLLRSGRKVVLNPTGDKQPTAFKGFSDDGSVIMISSDGDGPGHDSIYIQGAGGDVRRLTGYGGNVSSVALVGEQARAIVVDVGLGARVADARSSRDFAALRAHVWGLNVVTFSPDDRTILTLADDGKGRLWDAQTRRLRHTLPISEEVLDNGTITGYRKKLAAFRDDGRRLVTGNDKDEIQTWDVETGRPGCSVPGRSEQAGEYLLDVSFLAGGDYILAAYYTAGGRTTFINFLDARTCALAGTFGLNEWLGPGESIGAFSFSRDGTALITGILTYPFALGSDELRVWNLRGVDVRSGLPIRLAPSNVGRPPGSLRGYTFEGGQMLVVTEGDTGQLWVSGENSRVPLEGTQGGPHMFVYPVFSADGTRVAGTVGKEARVWDARTGKLLLAFECDMNALSRIHLSISPDGSRLLTANRDHTARIYPTSREAFLRVAKRLLGK